MPATYEEVWKMMELAERRLATSEECRNIQFAEIARLRAALTHALGLIVEFGDLNGFRNMTDAELGRAVTEVAKECAEALNEQQSVKDWVLSAFKPLCPNLNPQLS